MSTITCTFHIHSPLPFYNFRGIVRVTPHEALLAMPLSVVYNGATYYYILSLQGDVVAILDSSGVSVAEYTYDAWGRLLSTTGSMSGTLGLHNPLRYRGYVYDCETGLYYLQSRYYNPAICRFINADTFASTGQGILGHNMFAYCNNNPVKYVDHLGYFGICYAFDDPMNVYRAFMTPGMFGAGGGDYVAGVLTHNSCSNPNGKKGGISHQGTIQAIGSDLISRGYSVFYEYRVTTTGGYKNTRYLDIYATNGYDSFGVQVGLMTKGGLPVARERYAIDDILGAGISTVFITYK